MKRPGYVLVLFAFMFVSIMGLAALVIDIGFARLTQRQMQSAVDTAALEGLRNGSTTASGRQQASQMVGNLFSNSMDSSGGTIQYGAGPVVNFSGGNGPSNLAASQFISPGSPPVYQPFAQSTGTAGLETNYPENEQNGDMVAGTYGLNGTYSATSSADEDEYYNRRDFTPSSGTTAAAFLVRMRRTPLWNVTDSLDNTQYISTSGPPLPILFGRGSMMARSGSGSQLSVSSGIAVRATAIAAAGPVTFATSNGTVTYNAGLVKTVGPVDPGGTYPGHVSFAINSDVWARLATSGGTLTPSGGNLTITGGAPGVPPDGLVLATTASGMTLSASSASSIGQSVLPGTDSSALGAYPSAFAAYIPIYTTVSLGGQTYTVIGFGYLSPGRLQVSPSQVVISPPNGAPPAFPVAARNASGTIGLPTLVRFSTQDVSTLFQLHEGLANPLYAPVLVNHYIGPN